MLTYQNPFIKLSTPGVDPGSNQEERMERRAALHLLGLAGMAGAVNVFDADDASAAQASPASGSARVLRIYADEHGEAHLEEIPIVTSRNGQPRPVPNIPVGTMSVRGYAGASQTPNWHTAPARQFAIAITGELEVEVSGGVRHKVGTGDLVFLEDTAGKGHVTRMNGAVTNVFIRVADDFDVVAWARG